MAKVLGNQGSVTTTSTTSNWGSGVVVGSVTNWSVDHDAGMQDVTSFGSSGWSEFADGNKTVKGKATMIGDGTTLLAFAGTTNPTVALFLAGGASPSRGFSGTAVLSGFSVKVDGATSAPVSVDFSFAYTASVTIT